VVLTTLGDNYTWKEKYTWEERYAGNQGGNQLHHEDDGEERQDSGVFGVISYIQTFGDRRANAIFLNF